MNYRASITSPWGLAAIALAVGCAVSATNAQCGTFPGIVYGTGADPSSVAAGDLDGDDGLVLGAWGPCE